MTDIEIPLENERHGWYRFFEILPGVVSYIMLTVPFVLSWLNVELAAIFVIIYLFITFTRGIAGVVRMVHGYRVMREQQRLPWRQMLIELEQGKIADAEAQRPEWHIQALERAQVQPLFVAPSQIIHAVLIATYKETRETLQPTLESVLASDIDPQQVICVLAYEERGGEDTESLANELMAEYQGRFRAAFAVKHPAGLPNELIGKGGNVTYAGRELHKYLQKHRIDPKRVVVTTLDADNRPDPNYLNAVSYTYAAAPDPVHASYQPVVLYTNNVWDAPALSRVMAAGNSFFDMAIVLRLHALRNFSSHAQPMAALIETDFWSTRTVVEDGHQFWRTYFRFDGNYRVYPIYLPIYQDAVLAKGYLRTIRAQFIQIRRWTYGASDIAYFARNAFLRKNSIPLWERLTKFWRLFEGHITWAVGPLLGLGGGFVPLLFFPNSYLGNQLPQLISHVQMVATGTILVMVIVAYRLLPPRPARYKSHRILFMLAQWPFQLITPFVYGSLPAFNSQTRLIFKRYLSKFDVTEKAVVKESGETVTSGK